MKISYLLIGFGKTGGSIVLYNFMDKLVEYGHDVYAVTPNGSLKWEIGIWKKIIADEKVFSKKFTLEKLKLKVHDKINLILNHNDKYFKDISSLKKMISGLLNNWVESDVTIATFSWTAYAATALSDKTVPIYHMQHFEEIFFKDLFKRLITRMTYSLPIFKISNSLWLKNLLNKNFNVSSYLLNPGIDLSVFKNDGDYLKKYISKDNWTIVSFFDEEREWKGFDDAVSAVKLLREKLNKKNIKVNWKVFGLNPPSKKYETEFEYVGKLFNEDLAKLYASADIVLLTSWYESFPLPPIEAMACGTLVLSTQYGVEDYMIDNKNGLVTLPRKIEDMASKLEWAIMNPDKVRKIVEEGVNTSLKYNWDNRVKELLCIIEEVKQKHDFVKYNLFNDLVEGKFYDYMYEKFK
ncbi:glycosyltransferase family 4 protein [Geobacillus sp. FSL K6-0789]|uniref:glycosyltransferase family 4 protein n=1 Tax=Geobacillus sp. FSL K6-0789 TaxID=2954744 RepID=UPI003158241E